MTVSHGLFQWLSGEMTSLGDQMQGPKSKASGDASHPAIEITVGNMEANKKGLVQLQRQLWDAAFSGCLRPQAQ